MGTCSPMNERIYLDYNATTPVDPRVLAKMLPYFTQIFGNAASNDHGFGLEAKQAVDEARRQIAALINARPDEIIFTSGATESDNLAIMGVAEKYGAKGNHIITCVTEHKAVLDVCHKLELDGNRHGKFEMTYLPVDEYGRVQPEAIRQAITPKTILISIMAANNEIGTLAPLAEIGAIAAERGVLFHTDAAQAAGHVPLDVEMMNIHLMSLSAHKMCGPKGVGILYRRRSNPRVQLEPLLYGGGHERGLRSGTLNVPAIVGFGEAARIARQEMAAEDERFRTWTQGMYQRMQQLLGGVELNGHPIDRLPHNLNVSIQGIKARALIPQIKNIAIATGSACTSAEVKPSHVIQALGFGDGRAHSALRISVGRFNTDGEVETAVNQLAATMQKLRGITHSATKQN